MVKRSVWLLLIQAVLLIVTLPGNIVIARVLGPEQRGVFSILNNGILLALTVANLSYGTGLLVLTAKQRLRIRQSVFGAVLVAALIWLAVLAVMAGLPWLRTGVLFRNVPNRYVWLLLLTQFPAILLAMYLQSILQGINRVLTMSLLDAMAVLFNTMASLLCLLMLQGGLRSLVVILALQAPGSVTLLLYTLWRIDSGVQRPPLGALLEVFRFGLVKHLGNSGAYLLLRLDSVMLNVAYGAPSVGYYSVAISLAERLWLFGGVIEKLAYPAISASHEMEARAITATACRHSLIIGSAMATALAMIAHLLVKALYGASYLPAVQPLYLLLPGMVFYLMARIIDAFFTGQRGRPLITSAVTAGTLFLSVPIYLLLIRSWSMSGAAIASSVVYGLQLVILVALFCRDTGARASSLFLPRREDLRVYVLLTATLAERGRVAVGRSAGFKD